jgi:hypothetical protein
MTFKIVVFVPAFNEEDIIVATLRYLIDQGIHVHVIENWSTDATYDLISSFPGGGLLTIERFPKDGPAVHHDWKKMLARIEEITKEMEADWFLLQGADEIHASAWKDLNLKEGIQRVDSEGFNCIDHAVMTFHPVDNGFVAGTDYERYFKHFEFIDRPGHFLVINGWKNFGQAISLADSAGHEIRFEGRRVYPHKFLLKHYPVRSQAHGEKKIFEERKPRWSPENKAHGWHTHYDSVHSGHVFLRSPSGLNFYDESAFTAKPLANGLYLIDWADLAKSSLLSAKERTIQALQAQAAQKDAELSEIYRSKAWRLIQMLRRIRVALIPPGSTRDKLLHRIIK